MRTARNLCLAAAGLTALVIAARAVGGGQEETPRIRIVGSSTVYPFVTAAAEMFGEDARFPTPIVEATGTGGGFKLFCGGVGRAHPDINNASRPITGSERELCAKNGVTEITELAIGYDGIVLANKVGAPRFSLTRAQLFLALARQVPVDGKMTLNPYTRWREIDPRLPDAEITVYGPPPTSGTRDAFVELVMEAGCDAFPAVKAAYPDGKQRKAACHALREDGRFIEAGEDDNLIIQKLEGNEAALGIVGYSFMEENARRVQGSLIEGIPPDFRHIEDGSYRIARSLYVYFKNQNTEFTPGLFAFAHELASPAAIGPEGYLIQRGLLPLHREALEEMRARAAKLK